MGRHRRLGGHRLLDEIGRGSTAVVHLAMDGTGREVAVKELKEEFRADPDARRALARELAAQARVRSPYVARLLDGQVEGERPYAVMQYVPGTSLGDVVDAYGPFTGPALRTVARRLALGLADVHDAGVLHRDVAPRNVITLGERAMLIDFGIAHERGSDPFTGERPAMRSGSGARPGLVVGTPAYLAPELIEGEPASTASDVFSWAATVAFAATGRSPFGTGSLHGVCFRILRGAADLEGVPAGLDDLLRRGLDRDPARRPPARFFAGALAPDGPPAAESAIGKRVISA